ncbi:MAG: type VI secretion lipoprotein TssJ [Pseudomonadota bacterium]
MRRVMGLFFRGPSLLLGAPRFLLLTALVVALGGGCGTSQTLPPPKPVAPPTSKAAGDAPPPADNQEPYTLGPIKWSFWPKGVSIRIKAGPRLNEYEGRTHTVSVCIYQLSSSNVFLELCKQEAGVVSLLNCKSFDASVASFNRAILQPGRTLDLVLDRAEGAQFVGLAAGYFALQPDKSVRLVEIPADVIEKGVFTTNTYQRPSPLNLDVLLGPQYIENVENRSVAK